MFNVQSSKDMKFKGYKCLQKGAGKILVKAQ